MSKFDTMRDCKHGHQKGKCDSCDLEQSEKIIEQQQQQIVQLEQRNNELSVMVESLYNALRHLHHNAKASGAEMGLALDVAEEALESTPQQNLNTVKRSALLELANGLKNNDPYTPALMGSGDIRKYANTNYPSGKE